MGGLEAMLIVAAGTAIVLLVLAVPKQKRED
jgi:hypothetical protein